MTTSKKQRDAKPLRKAKALLKKAKKDEKAGVNGAGERQAIHEATKHRLETAGGPKGAGPMRV
ncbi:hypothetical protein ACFOLJ_19540 [Rugamonas sp. CCM 8940]|uniref:hypothetical protein n=1 Tax=Rugamonas sp. CCM 8940 TaxID=2765359 RepID=UPI0018F6E6C4|nr:hypothetical protein [Rugamonas sp. CCM 8940]MBJ7312301.1 hypothetical protein [Rugamonas sp. CCM 8940]